MAQALPSSSLGTYALAPYWSNLHIPPNSADYDVTYAFTSKSVTVGWRVLQDGVQQTSHAKGLCHFELTYLTDRPDYVEFIYMGDSDPSCLSGESASIGVQSGQPKISQSLA